MRRFVIAVVLISILLLTGCVSLTVTQELDSKPEKRLIIDAKVSDNSDARSVSDAVKEINCKFNAEESKKESGTYLTYTSDNCVLSGVKLNKLGDNIYRYSFDSSNFKQYSSKITDASYILKIAGNVIETNGINIGYNQVKFLISNDDINNKYVYFVEYNLSCKYDSECTSDGACINFACTKLNCGECQYLENHKCKNYDCCSNDDCKNNQICEVHNCIDINCLPNQHAEDHICAWNCVDNSNCKESEECRNHSCELLNCGLFEKLSNHKCVSNLFVASIVLIVLLLVIATVIVMYWNSKNKHKKKNQK